jgi:alginate O-acetyltransferase complex protein AlgI
MAIGQILILTAIALFWGIFIRDRGRVYFLLIVSTIVIFWLQPALPLRGFDFWLPVATLAVTIFSWYITAPTGSRRERKNLIVIGVLFAIVFLLDIVRYLPFNVYLTATRPPRIDALAALLVMLGLIFLLFSRSKKPSGILLVVGFSGLIAIFLMIKVPAFAYWASYSIRSVFGQSLDEAKVTDLRWLGFSYVAFRLLHTIRDRQTGKLPDVSLAEYVTYVIFFPAFTAGPIDRIERFTGDLRRPMVLDNDASLLAGKRLLVGLFKKFVVADSLALIALNDVNALQVRTGGWMWVLLYAYTLQIYFDFSGYTDIAIGMGRLLGIQLPENFLAPYLKPNLTQFWNNWHMTLTQWFRAYFFNPVTRWLRSREKPLPLPLMILMTQVSTMVLIGFWHGVTLNFTLWGLWHGVGLFLHNRWSDLTRARASDWATTPFRRGFLTVSGVFLTFHFVALGWLFFALSAPSLSLHVFLKLFGIR